MYYLVSSAFLCKVAHTPTLLQLEGQFSLSHAVPEYPSMHWHLPNVLSQRPLLEHSARPCALSVATA